MPVIIPMWFYEFGSAMYFFAAVIAFILSFFSYKLYSFTRKRYHLLLNLAFVFIAFGFAILAITNFYGHYYFENCEVGCVISSVKDVYDWVLLGNYTYYIASIIGYVLLIFSFSETRTKKKQLFSFFFVNIPILLRLQPFYVLYPFENAYFSTFHILSSILLAIIVFQTFSNYKKTKLRLSLLFTLSFVAILFYHILMFIIPFSPVFFALAHFSLLLGFGSLLFILIKVNK